MNSPHLERGGLPIREVTRLTGVHPVTLRAWERRYGLVVPQRTGKGHRLYSEEQVERIRRILVWLERGVAISVFLRTRLITASILPESSYCSGYRRSLWQATPCWSTMVKLKFPLRVAWIRQSNGANAAVRVRIAS